MTLDTGVRIGVGVGVEVGGVVPLGVGVSIGVGVAVDVAVAVGVGVDDRPGLVIVFVSSVTAPVTVKRRPTTELPPTAVIEVPAIRFPVKVVPLASVTAVPT